MVNKKKSIHVTLALPTFLQSEKVLFADFPNEYQKIIQTARYSQGVMLDAMLFDRLSSSFIQNPPFASISAIGYGLNSEEGNWLRIDPVELLVDAGNICLIGRDHLVLENNETQQLLKTLNNLLQEDKIIIQAGAPHEWFFDLNQLPDITTYPLHEAVAKDIRAFLPTGSNQKWWRKLLTELQMLLFQHAVNEQRQNFGKPVVNGVWLWGEGKAAKSYDLKTYDAVWSDSALIKGMIALGKQTISLLPENQFKIENLCGSGHYLITTDPHRLGREPTAEIIMGLLQKILAYEIHQLTLCLGNGNILQWQARRRFFNFITR